jgi:hypothetical protein
MKNIKEKFSLSYFYSSQKEGGKERKRTKAINKGSKYALTPSRHVLIRKEKHALNLPPHVLIAKRKTTLDFGTLEL